MSIRDQAFQGKPLSPFIIDAHTHLAPYYKMGWHQKPDFTTVESVIRVYDEMGVNCCVTAPHMIIDSMTTWANETAAAAAKDFPGRIYGYISVAPFEGMEVLRENLKRFGGNPAFVGLKFLGGYNGDYTEPVYRYATDFANETGCPILCHTWGNTPTLEVLRDMAETHPRLNILCAHQGGGSRELTFRTDVINLDARFDFGRVAFSPLSDEAKEKIFAGNYLRLLEKSQMGSISR